MGVLVSYDYLVGFKSKDLAYIGKLLEKQPFGEVNSLILDVQRQINEQDMAKRDELAAAMERQKNDAIEAEIERRRQTGAPLPIEAQHAQTSNEVDADVKGQPVEEQPDQPAETLIEKGD